MHRLAALVIVGVGCGSSPAPQPTQPTPSAPAPQPAPPPQVAAQQFANGDMGYRYDDADRKQKLVAAAQKIDTVVADEMTRQHLPGLALGIVVDGELVYSKGYGVADVDAKTTPDLDTAYRIGSLTKSFTALSVLSLRDRGVLTLDDPLVHQRRVCPLTRESRHVPRRRDRPRRAGLGNRGDLRPWHRALLRRREEVEADHHPRHACRRWLAVRGAIEG